ncbi:MAG: hypothetical protein EOO39_19040 [Cytophagaceae bacterium]|nr:MAG: hypothetical protein EOO39_19040 [Cytophagaceae bacterium]
MTPRICPMVEAIQLLLNKALNEHCAGIEIVDDERRHYLRSHNHSKTPRHNGAFFFSHKTE